MGLPPTIPLVARASFRQLWYYVLVFSLEDPEMMVF